MYDSIKQQPKIWGRFIAKGDEFGQYSSVDSYCDLEKHDTGEVLSPDVSRTFIENGLEVEFPEDRKFGVCLTHDIDDIYPPFHHSFLSMLHSVKDANLAQLKKHTLWRVNGKQQSPYINFKEIMDIEEKFDAKSSFYFLTAEKDPRRFRYDIEDVGNYMREIVDRGCEVGLHGGYYSYDNYENVVHEKKKLEAVLGKPVIGFRNHYLKLKISESWEILSKAGFKYDTTLGFNNVVGFRNGMCHPFRPYAEGKALDILEIPLNIMDIALFEQAGSFRQAWEISKQILDVGHKYNGIITLLWHNNIFSSPHLKEWNKLYVKILDYCNQKNAWITSCENIYEWWNNADVEYP
ncbi:polysaccharide deacetylase family protein [Methanolobus sp.]|uniref:polysaccharide deacetylase family protein n=1 Tax=Methanolobus sp. TaxID=1874737 RepID=UPI0025DCC781|nr:polysaccharide deacetylase family protein [Methanolobus sp.]